MFLTTNGLSMELENVPHSINVRCSYGYGEDCLALESPLPLILLRCIFCHMRDRQKIPFRTHTIRTPRRTAQILAQLISTKSKIRLRQVLTVSVISLLIFTNKSSFTQSACYPLVKTFIITPK
jgi:hypothetical protein